MLPHSSSSFIFIDKNIFECSNIFQLVEASVISSCTGPHQTEHWLCCCCTDCAALCWNRLNLFMCSCSLCLLNNYNTTHSSPAAPAWCCCSPTTKTLNTLSILVYKARCASVRLCVPSLMCYICFVKSFQYSIFILHSKNLVNKLLLANWNKILPRFEGAH